MTHTVVTGVYLEGNRAVGVQLCEKGRIVNVSSKMLVDATSDGHVIRICPVKTALGRDSDGKTVPFTVRAQMLDGNGRYRYNNGDSGYCNQYRAEEFSRNIIDAHAARAHMPQSGKRLVTIAPICGVREGVRYEGEEILRYEDILLGKKPERVLFYAYSDIDRHGYDWALESEFFQNWWVLSNLATVTLRIPVPLGAAAPKGLLGIVTSGRCLSVDSYSSSAGRMNRDMFRMGECVGIAVSMAVKSGCGFVDIDYGEYIKKVNSYGCFLGDPEKNCGFAHPENKIPFRSVNFRLSNNEIIEVLSTDTPGVAVWSSYRYGDEALVRKLTEALDGNGEFLKYNAAIALGIMGRGEGLELLRELVRNRSNFYFKDCRRSNQFRSVVAICILGRLGEKEDIDLLKPIVFDNGEFDRELYTTFEPTPMTCALEQCNFVLYQHFTHAAAALVKLSKKHGYDIGAELADRFTGRNRELILSNITDQPPTGAFYAEISDFMSHILKKIGI